MKIRNYKKLHLTGVKGVGMTALAEILLANDFTLTGSDVEEKFITDEVLDRLGVKVASFNENNIRGAEALIHSNAYKPEHEEIAGARKIDLPVFSYPEVVAQFFNSVFGVAVAGSHGKTTTTAMLAHILKQAGKNVTAIVGSKILDWGSGAAAGDLNKPDAIFVLEADEYKEAFLNYRPRAAIITNIDYDHPDYFANRERYEEAFAKFIDLVSPDGFLIVNKNDECLSRLAGLSRAKVIFAGADDLPPDASLRLGGEHNRLNAALAFSAARELGVDDSAARAALADFRGTARRMELIGERNGAPIFDDYAHHPTEIKATLGALRERYPNKKIAAVFMPHTYSRTRALFDDFAAAFDDADAIVLTGVYTSAREKPDESIDMAQMAKEVNQNGRETVFVKDKNLVSGFLEKFLNSDSVIITMGAGDIWQVAHNLVKHP